MKLSRKQVDLLPDLVALALVGFSLVKADKGASEWSHPALAAFKDAVELEFARRELKRLQSREAFFDNIETLPFLERKIAEKAAEIERLERVK